MTLSAESRAELVAAGQIALLEALLRSADGTATVDDATSDLSAKFERGGKWRGSIPSRLARNRIIERIGDCKSDRPSRHRSYVSVWRLVDRARALHEIDRLLAIRTISKENPQAAATDCGHVESIIYNPTL
jgi:hypothetical protein